MTGVIPKAFEILCDTNNVSPSVRGPYFARPAANKPNWTFWYVSDYAGYNVIGRMCSMSRALELSEKFNAEAGS